MKILRVFPRRTKLTPCDELAFVGDPPLWRPEADEVHVSCCFTWDIDEAHRLARAWRTFYPVVKLGGPALGDRGDAFIPGRYLGGAGKVILSRGCPNRCPWCLVPDREGPLRELGIQSGHDIQDNNATAFNGSYADAMFDMLREQRRYVRFSGGLESARLNTWWYDKLQSIKIREVWLALDRPGQKKTTIKAIRKLRSLGLKRPQIRCYVLLGYDEPVMNALDRLEAIWHAGGFAFAQLYRPEIPIPYTMAEKKFARNWSRPIDQLSMHSKGGSK